MYTRRWPFFVFIALAMLVILAPTLAQGPSTATAPAPASSPDGVWVAASDAGPDFLARPLGARPAIVRLNKPALDAILASAPPERGPDGAAMAAGGQGAVLTLPMPDGGFARFAIVRSPILAPELALAFPEFQTYSGRGLDDLTATVRLDWTAAGLHAMVIGEGGTIDVDPRAAGDTENYVAIRQPGRPPDGAGTMCLLTGDTDALARSLADRPLVSIANGATLRVYRLALAATAEYTAAAGGTKPLALSRMVTTINRVNVIFARELALIMTLATGTAGDSTALIYTDGGTDPYSNGNAAAMLAENQTTIDAVLGSANYDVGHVFGTGTSGLAVLGSACGAAKAQGVSQSPIPDGESFDRIMATHEFAHQFGALHSFNGTSGFCGPNRMPAGAYEPGSGSTLMSYAGNCGVENLQDFPHDYFHVSSLNQIKAFMEGAGSCAVTASTGNSVPTVTAPPDMTIPAQTPFKLDITASSDADNDTLIYTWEEYDLGAASSSAATASRDDGTRPLFRPQMPQRFGFFRYFPSGLFVLDHDNVPPATYLGTLFFHNVCLIDECLIGEVLPAVSRPAMNFVVTARDSRPDGGAFATDMVTLTVDATKGPLRVTTADNPASPVTWTHASQQTVTWDVNGTAALAPNVRIVVVGGDFVVTSGPIDEIVALASTPNDGAAVSTVPYFLMINGRIRVEAIGNVFYDLSGPNLTIVNTAPTISAIANQNVDEDAVLGPIPFTINDADTPESLTVTASSNNQAIIPNSSIRLEGTGLSRTVTVTPPPNVSGSAVIQIVVSDGTAYAVEEFFVFVVQVNDLPTISDVPDQVTDEDVPIGPITFTLSDLEWGATPAILEVWVTSSNPTLFPTVNNLVLGSTATLTRTLTIKPAANQSGTATITLTVLDGGGVVFDSFVVTVNPVNDPPTVTQFLGGPRIYEDTTLNSHSFLVGDVETPLADLVVTATSSNQALVADAGISIAPGSIPGRTLSVTPLPNQWGTAAITIAVRDGSATSTGTFQLTVEAVHDPPTISAVPDQTMMAGTTLGPIPFTVGSVDVDPGTLVVTARAAHNDLTAALVLSGSGANRTVTFSALPGRAGGVAIFLDASDGFLTVRKTFIIEVLNPTNRQPTISAIADQLIYHGTTHGPIPIVVSDPDTPVANLTLMALTRDASIVHPLDVSFAGSGANRTMTITPRHGPDGTTEVIVYVSDGAVSNASAFMATVKVAVPANLRASVSGSTAAFSWDPAPGATGYLLKARFTPDGPVIATLPLGLSTAFSVQAPPGVYYVTVQTLVGPLISEPSNQVGLAVGFAPAPVDVTTTATGSSFGVAWRHSPLAADRTGYQLRVGTRSGLADLATLGLPAAATGFDTSSVIAGVPFGRYYITVIAQPAGGASAAPEVVAAVGTPPVLTRTGSTLSWTASGAPGGYRLEAGFSPGTTALELPMTGTSFTIPGGVAAGTYYLRMAAVYALGNSLASNEITLMLADATLDAAPR